MPKSRMITMSEEEYREMKRENLKMREGLIALATLVKHQNRSEKKAEQIRKIVSSQLRETIKVHGPIDDDHGDIGSATKRISGQFYGLISAWAKSLLESAGCPIVEPPPHIVPWKPPKRDRFVNMPPIALNRF